MAGRKSLACLCVTYIQALCPLRCDLQQHDFEQGFAAFYKRKTSRYCFGLQALTEYWNNLPAEHKDTLFSMREEDFVAELDAHMKYQLKVMNGVISASRLVDA